MNSHSRTIACAASLLILAACGGKESVASKSAAAYREAQAKGIPLGGGHTQHESAATATSAATDHSAHGTMDHSAHAATASVDHAAMGHGTASSHAGHAAASASTGHAQHASGHAATASANGGHAAHAATASPSASHDQHMSMQHGSTPSAPADPHAQHRTTATTTPTAPAPSSGTISTRIEPASTLRPDAFDAPVAVSVAEAKKTAGNVDDVYACPMHPEVTSTQPGTCPKCGMALVKRTKQ